MKILFAIQGTGNGHISRAREIIPFLRQYGELDLLVSGTQADVNLPWPVKYKLHGLSFTFGKRGGVDIWDSFRALRTRQIIRDIRKLPVHEYDLVINDFEPISAWACRLRKKPCIALSHQAAFLSAQTPRPAKGNFFAELVLKHYAPSTSAIGFHFEPYDHFIHTPVIRREIRELHSEDLGHITVYLPAYDDTFLVNYFEKVKNVRWEVFTKHSKQTYEKGHIRVMPIQNEAYTKSLATCHGLITGGGFEAPTEAIYLGKKVMVIPMINQYEQHCNALGAKKAGCTVIGEINGNFLNQLQSWIDYGKAVHIDYPDETAQIVAQLMRDHAVTSLTNPVQAETR